MSQSERTNQVQEIYQEWSQDESKRKLYSVFNAAELHARHSRERVTLSMLNRIGRTNIEECSILEVGCGRGNQIGDYLRWGCLPGQITGIDILPDFIAEARARYPGVSLMEGSVLDLPFEDASFDILSQGTVMSSLPDEADREKMAEEMTRVLKPGGLLLWFDFRYPSPGNRNVKPIRAGELRALFPDYEVHLRSLTLLPPIARRIAPVSSTLASLLEIIPPMRSHYRGVLIKLGDA